MLALLVSAAAWADTISYTGVNGPQLYTITTSGLYRVVAAGAQGGNSAFRTGGLGAVIGGDYHFNAGELLTLYIGQSGTAGTLYGGGGGGGTFLTWNAGSPLIVAGGGGGASRFVTGNHANTGTSGGNGTNHRGEIGALGGSNGAGGGAVAAPGGGGFLTAGDSFDCATGGAAFPSLLGGGGCPDGAAGGFGGGGGGGFQSSGGGGGGYSGGGGGGAVGFAGPGGGGGSFLHPSAVNPSLTVGNTGNGYVRIELLQADPPPPPTGVPEPLPTAVLGSALVALVTLRRRHQPTSKRP